MRGAPMASMDRTCVWVSIVVCCLLPTCAGSAVLPVRSVTSRRASLDFTSSEQGFRSVTQLVADGTVLVNATELCSWAPSRVQMIVCDHCGQDGCQPGGWLTMRNIGDAVALIPA